jgi:UDP:flavonoid glycosyltransferase YjiC (YdhE family)
MRFLIIPFGSSGDVHPFVGLALAVRERGHRVTCVINGYFRTLFARTGLDFIELGNGDDFLELASHPDLWHPLRSFNYLMHAGVARFMRDHYRLVAEQCAAEPTIVLANCLGFGSRFAQEKLAAPLVSVHLQPSVLWSEYQSPEFSTMMPSCWMPRWLKRWQYNLAEKLVIDRAANSATGTFRQELGLPPLRRTTRWWHSPRCVLALFPEWFAPPQPDWPANVHLTQFPLWDEATITAPQPALEEYLSSGTPPLVFTPGSANVQASEFFAAAVRACHRLGRRGLLLTKFAEQVPRELPAGVRHFAYVPFSQVLPRSTAIVHHGGVGTTAQGLRAGIPQLIMPLSHDQPDNAARLKRLGVGDWLAPAKFRGDALAHKLDLLLGTPQVQTHCEQMAARFQGVDPLAEACTVLEQFADEVASGRAKKSKTESGRFARQS